MNLISDIIINQLTCQTIQNGQQCVVFYIHRVETHVVHVGQESARWFLCFIMHAHGRNI